MSDERFNRLVEIIMIRDFQCFLNMLIQDGARLPHEFDVTQILEEDPNQASGNDGRDRRECTVSESPSCLFKKPKLTHTCAYMNDARQTHEQPRARTFQGQRNPNAYVRNCLQKI